MDMFLENMYIQFQALITGFNYMRSFLNNFLRTCCTFAVAFLLCCGGRQNNGSRKYAHLWARQTTITDSDTLRAFKAILDAQKDEDENVRLAAAEALWRIDPASRETVVALKRALIDEKESVRKLGAELLGRIGPSAGEVVHALARALSDRRVSVRKAAADALGEIGPAASEAKPVLKQARIDEDKAVRKSVEAALVKINTPYPAQPVHQQQSEARPAAGDSTESADVQEATVQKSSPDTGENENTIDTEDLKKIPVYIEKLQNGSVSEINVASMALSEMGPAAEPAVRALMSNLRDDNAEIRFLAARTLGYIGPKARRSVRSLIRAVSDKDESVKYEAIIALGKIGPRARPAIRTLAALLKKQDGQTRMLAARALAGIGNTSIKTLVRTLKSRDRKIRAPVMDALVETGPASVKHLVKILRSRPRYDRQQEQKDWSVHRCAAEVLGKIGQDAADAVPALVDMLEDSGIRKTAAEALGNIGPGAVDAIGDLSSALKDEDKELRKIAAKALGKIGAEAEYAVRDLTMVLKDENYHVRRAAAESLALIGSASVPVLVEALSNGDDDLPEMAAATLMKIGPAAKEAASALSKTVSAPDPKLRRQSIESLAAILGSEITRNTKEEDQPL